MAQPHHRGHELHWWGQRGTGGVLPGERVRRSVEAHVASMHVPRPWANFFRSALMEGVPICIYMYALTVELLVTDVPELRSFMI